MTNRIDRLVSVEEDLRADVVDTLLRATRRLRVGGKHERAAGARHGLDQINAPHGPRIQDWLLDEIELTTRVAYALEAENKRDRQRPITRRLLQAE